LLLINIVRGSYPLRRLYFKKIQLKTP